MWAGVKWDYVTFPGVAFPGVGLCNTSWKKLVQFREILDQQPGGGRFQEKPGVSRQNRESWQLCLYEEATEETVRD